MPSTLQYAETRTRNVLQNSTEKCQLSSIASLTSGRGARGSNRALQMVEVRSLSHTHSRCPPLRVVRIPTVRICPQLQRRPGPGAVAGPSSVHTCIYRVSYRDGPDGAADAAGRRLHTQVWDGTFAVATAFRRWY